MRALLVILLLLPLAAGCAREPRPPVGPPRVTAAPVDDGAAVQVRVVGLMPGARVAGIRLVAPDGTALTPAERRESRTHAGGGGAASSVGVGATGGSASGINPFVTLSLDFLGGDGGPERRTRQIVARIPLPDPAAYRDTAADWRLEVDLVDVAGAKRTRTLPAPRP